MDGFLWHSAKAVLLLLLIADTLAAPSKGAPKLIKRIAPGTDEPSIEQPDELVDVKLDTLADGEMNLKFRSHGRLHNLTLTESKQNLSAIRLNFLGIPDIDQQRVRNRLQHIKLMRDVKHEATIAVNYVEGGNAEPILEGGVFKLGKHEFHIKPERYRSSKAMVSKRSVKLDVDYGMDGVHVDIKRKKREVSEEITPISAVVELVMIADYELWKHLRYIYSRTEEAEDQMTGVLLYLAHMTQIMDSYYGTMRNDDIQITVELAGLVVITDSNQLSDLTEEYKIYYEGYYYVGGIAALTRLSEWLATDEASAVVPPHDHTMLLTGCDMYDEATVNIGLLGLAYVGTVCDPQLSSSIVEARGLLTFIASTAAHELGHSLGSSHDGVWGNSESCSDENYVMASTASSSLYQLNNQFLFSCCSQRSFYGTISTVQCLEMSSSEPNYPDSINENIADFLPGQIFDADDQCYIAFGTSECSEQTYSFNGLDRCEILLCVSPDDSSNCVTSYIAAADGTECGSNRWCYQGECVPEGTVYQTLDQHCNVRDCYGQESRCNSGINSISPALVQCYRDIQRCDTVRHCTDGSDENDLCPPFVCPSGYTKCLNGTTNGAIEDIPVVCVPDEWICDDITDCTDGSDELPCDTTTSDVKETTTPSTTTTTTTPRATTTTTTPRATTTTTPSATTTTTPSATTTTTPTPNTTTTTTATAITTTLKVNASSTNETTTKLTTTTLVMSSETSSKTVGELSTTTSSSRRGIRKLRFKTVIRIIKFLTENFTCDDPDLQVNNSEAYQLFSDAVCEAINRYVNKSTCLSVQVSCGSIIAAVDLEIEQRDGEDPEVAGPANVEELRRDIAGILDDIELVVYDVPVVEDINECADVSLNDCSPNSICINTDGYYSCTCNFAYSVDLSIYEDEKGRVCARSCDGFCDVEGEICEVVADGVPTCTCPAGVTCGAEIIAIMVGVLGGMALFVITVYAIAYAIRRRNQRRNKEIS